MRSIKSVNYSIGKYGQILDNFTIECDGTYDNISNITGFLWMYWPDGFVKWIYPDIIIAISNNTIYNNKLSKYQYEWLIEYQCLDKTEINGDISEVYYVFMLV